jgi:pimeloyl-ACP methyl ester carboxylesterase
MPSQLTVQFQSDEFKLVGSLHLPDSDNAPLVIGCHGLLANRNSPKQIDLARACNDNRMAYFRFDHRGCGDSQGDFNSVTTLATRCRDLHCAVKTMSAHPAVGRCVGLFGSSFGGTVVLAYAGDHKVPKLMTYAAPINSHSIQRAAIRDNQGQLHPAAQLPAALAFDIAPNLNSIRNIVIVHSRNDETVPVAHAHQIHERVGDPKSLQVLKGGDHRMSDTDHQQLFRALFIQWFKE